MSWPDLPPFEQDVIEKNSEQTWLAVKSMRDALLQLPQILNTPRLHNPTLQRPGIVRDGDLWIEASGVSPARNIDVMVQDLGVAKRILRYTY